MMRDIKNDVVENKHGILHNKQSIQQNKDAIQEIKQGCSNRCITQDILMRITDKFESTMRHMIIALCIITALLLISNAIWLILWNTRGGTTIITNDGTSNVIGHDGSIK